MRICLFLDPSRAFRWHDWLVKELALSGLNGVTVCFAERSQSWPPGIELSMRLDRLLNRISGERAIDRIETSSLGCPQTSDLVSADMFDILLDCSGSSFETPRPRAQRVLTLLFDGIPSELGAVDALLESREIVVSVHDTEALNAIGNARPATERKASLVEVLDNILSRAVEMLVDRVERSANGAGSCTTADTNLPASVARNSDPSSRLTAAAFRHLSRLVAGKIGRKLTRTVTKGGRWALAVRHCPGPGLIAGPWPGKAAYRVVRDDGRRYYADPFVYRHAGKTYLFCEEFSYSTGRGLISVCEVAADGTVGTPYPVLERPYHLSYPFVFEDAGQIWMIPEAAASGAVELYRCAEFPRRWELEHRLVEGVAGCDATLLKRDGRYWMFVTSMLWRSTSWDNLRLYEAPSLHGPWQPHATGLALIDSRLCRSAGALVEKDGMLLRPTQDCSSFYGGGMLVSRIDLLNTDEYSQTPVAEIVPAGPSGITGTHTYSKSGDIEAVDFWGEVEGVTDVTLLCRPLPISRSADQ